MITFNPEITLGSVLQVVTMIAVVAALWFKLREEITLMQYRLGLLEQSHTNLVRDFRAAMLRTSDKLPLLLFLLLTLSLSGCGSLVPSERQRQVAVESSGETHVETTAEIMKRVGDALPPINIAKVGKNAAVTLNVLPQDATSSARLDTRSRAGNTETDQAFTSITIPLGVKLLLIAAGIAALLAVFLFVRRSSAAVNAAYRAADGALARTIDRKTQAAAMSTDALAIAQYTVELAAIEKERGKLASQQP